MVFELNDVGVSGRCQHHQLALDIALFGDVLHHDLQRDPMLRHVDSFRQKHHAENPLSQLLDETVQATDDVPNAGQGVLVDDFLSPRLVYGRNSGDLLDDGIRQRLGYGHSIA